MKIYLEQLIVFQSICKGTPLKTPNRNTVIRDSYYELLGQFSDVDSFLVVNLDMDGITEFDIACDVDILRLESFLRKSDFQVIRQFGKVYLPKKVLLTWKYFISVKAFYL